MCPLRYLYLVLCFVLTNLFVFCAGWKAEFDPKNTTIKTSTTQRINLVLSNLDDEIISNINDRNYLQLRNSESGVAEVINQDEIKFVELDRGNMSWKGYFDVSGVFIGSSKITVELKRQPNKVEVSNESLDVVVIRPKRFIDTLFITSVIVLMSILYINFGAALSMNNLKQILRRPIGPIICFIGQFLFMPLTSYFLGTLLFNQNSDMSHALALGLFFVGISPGGGASNVWAAILGGNIDLSIAMTTISTLASFAMMPLWVFTLGGNIFERASLGVPYRRITTTAIGLLIPLGIGLAIQKWAPKTAKFLVRILKPLSLLLILFIVIFAIITNLYIFQLFSWQIIIAGLGLPWLGYLFGYFVARIFRQPNADAIAISVETGIQNTGISIFMLTFALEQPMADLTTVVPVSVAIMTPFPLLGLYIFKKIKNLYFPDKSLSKQLPMIESETTSSLT